MKNYFRYEDENLETFENPHLIYKELQKKEEEAFSSTINFEKIRNNFQSLEGLPSKTNEDFTSSSSKETGSTVNARHRKNIQSVQVGFMPISKISPNVDFDQK